MEDRLVKAYDRMTMPENCADRIERALEREMKTRERGKRTRAMAPLPRRRDWTAAAAVVLLVLMLSVAGSFLLLNAGNQRDAEPVSLSPATESTEESESFTLTEEGKAFLEKMCYYMPDWLGYDSLDDDFWYCFLHDSFTCPELTGDGKALTVAGEAAYSDGMVKISREAAAEYVKLAMNCELPEFAPEYDELEPELNILYYEDGFYYIAVSDFGSVGYTYRKWEVHQEAYDTYAYAIFDVYEGEPDRVFATVTFMVYPAENENGFTIISKETRNLELPAAGDVVWDFAQAYFWGSPEDLLPYLADSFSGKAETYSGGDVTLRRTNVEGVGYAEVGTGLTTSVEFQAAGEDSLTYLTIDLIRQEDGWRVQGYGLEK